MPFDCPSSATDAHDEVRERILRTASELFCRDGARAVGGDLIVERAGVAKNEPLPDFGTNDDLIAAFLDREDEQFWNQWESIARRSDTQAELDAHMQWIGKRLAGSNIAVVRG